MKKILLILSCLLVLLTGCTTSNNQNDDNIIILFTNDTHGAIDDNIGFASLAGYKKEVEKESKYVTLVDIGDEIQGSYLTTLSKGQIGIDTLNLIGYKYATFGNHEFDLGGDRLKELVDSANYQFITTNVSYSGNSSNPFEGVPSYVIDEYGKYKVAFLGVTTPNTLKDAGMELLKEDDELVFDFCSGNNGQELIDKIQETVDEVKSKGADYVVLMAHLGTEDENDVYSSKVICENTNGIDVILDGHSHATCIDEYKNLDGELVPVAQTGTKLEHIGKVVIHKDGSLNVELVSTVMYQDNDTLDSITDMKKQYDEIIEGIIGNAPKTLSLKSEDGVRIVRNRETEIGNLCADAFRDYYGTDIAYLNAGGIRADLKQGTITYADVINVLSFGNLVASTNITGQELLDMLEYFVKDVKEDYKDKDGNAVGENGSYCCMSGVRFTLNLDIPTSVIMDEDENLLGIGDTRRVSDVEVLENGEYVPIDLEKTYSFTSCSHVLYEGGSGMAIFLKDHPLVNDESVTDYEVLAHYIKETLNGSTEKYNEIDNRVILKNN